MPGKKGEGLVFFSFSVDFLPEDLEAKYHDEEASQDGVDHVEEEVSVVEVAHAVVEPGTVVVHLEDAMIANRAVVRSRRLGRDALLADGHHLRHDPLDRGFSRVGSQGHPVVEDDVDEEPLAKDDEEDGQLGVVVPVVRKPDGVGDPNDQGV